MVIYVDIDETICYNEGNSSEARNYAFAKPILVNIDKFNSLYDKGHTIVYWTARGTVTGIDWSKITEEQFSRWGVKYHQIKFGKPAFDIFVDDKVLNSERINEIDRYISDDK